MESEVLEAYERLVNAFRERTDSGEQTVHEVETIVFGKQPDGRWLIVHQHLSPQPD